MQADSIPSNKQPSIPHVGFQKSSSSRRRDLGSARMQSLSFHYQSCWPGTAFLWPSTISFCMRPGFRISRRKRSCCSSSSAQRVGPGWLHTNDQSAVPPTGLRLVNKACSLEEFCVCGILEVLQVAEVGDKFRLLVHFLGSQKIKIGRIRKALNKLGVGVLIESGQG